jgi:hypothetical protein
MSKYKSINVDHIKKHVPPEVEDFQGFMTDKGIQIFRSIDHGRYHMSISRQDRYPTWDEIKDARENLLPLGKHFVMALPPPQHYINTYSNCFHLWECLPDREKDLIWTFEQG